MYGISFEITKLTKHWNNENDNQLAWTLTENEPAAPFGPIETLSHESPAYVFEGVNIISQFQKPG